MEYRQESGNSRQDQLASAFRGLIKEFRQGAGSEKELSAAVSRAFSQALTSELCEISQVGSLLEDEIILQKVIDTLPSNVAILNENGEIVLINKHWESLGQDNDFVPERNGIGLNYIEVCERAAGTNSEGAAETAYGIRSTVRGQLDQFVLDYPCHAPREQRWFRLISTPLVPGEARGAIVMHVPITEVILAKAAAEENERYLQTILNTMPECVKIVDRDFNLVHMNPAGLRMMEVEDLEGLKGKPVAPFVDPDHLDGYLESYRRALGGESVKLTYGIIGSGGTERSMESHCAPFRDQAGDITAVLSVSHDITERVRITEEKDRADSLLKAASQLTKTSGWEINVSDMKLYWSDMMRVILEVPDDMELGLDDEALYCSLDDKDHVSRCILECIADGKPYEIEMQLKTYTGRRIWTKSSGAPVYGPDGQVVKVRGAFSDITDSKMALEKLKESEERFRSFLEGIPTVPIKGFAPDGTIQYWNKAAENLYGYSAEEAIGKDIVDLLILPEDRKGSRDMIRAAVENDVPMPDLEVTLLKRGGGHVSVYTSHTLVRREGRDPEIFCIDIDLSVRRKLEADLATSEERFRYIAQATVDVAWDWNIETDELWWSEKMTDVFGHQLAELEMDLTSWVSRLHPEDVERVMTSVHAVLDHGETLWESNYRFKKSDTDFAQVFDRGFVIRDPIGNPIRMVGGMSDVTSTIKLEEQLRQSQRLETVGQLTGGIAHDFNNLLTVIMGNAEILSDQLESAPKLQGFAKMIFGAAGRGAQLTQRLLSFARRQPLDPTAVDIPELMREMSELMRRTLGESIALDLRHSKSSWDALVDPTQLENAVLNLSLNACDAMPDGGRLTIEVSDAQICEDKVEEGNEVETGDYVLIAVSDDGSGMSKEQISRAFEPFYTTKPEGRGTGLGLSMVYGFVKQSKGHISIYSELDVGTTIKMYLPKATSEEQLEVELRVDPENAAGSETVLLVEDDEFVRQFAESLLRLLGYEVVVAVDGPEAVATLETEVHVDLLFTDVVMSGGMNGKQLAEQALILRPGLKILYTSGYTEDVILHHGRLDAGAELLSKPYARSELAQKLRDVLDRH